MDFIDKYPLTRFMTEDQIDYDTSLIHNDVDINVALIGFGKTNQQLFLTSVANNQFMTEENGEKVAKPVHYYSFMIDSNCVSIEVDRLPPKTKCFRLTKSII